MLSAVEMSKTNGALKVVLKKDPNKMDIDSTVGSTAPSVTGKSDHSGKEVEDTPDSSEVEDEDENTAPVIATGMQCGFKALYSGPEDEKGRYNWVDTIPSDLGAAVENAETAKWALIVRHVKVFNDPRRVLRIHSIVIQSPLLKDFLGKVLKNYPGVTTTLQRLTFSGKFEPLIHRWLELQAAIAAEDDVTTKEHAELLYNILAKELKEIVAESTDMIANQVISFDLLWTLFQPGALIYARRDGQECVFKLSGGNYGALVSGARVYQLACQYVEWGASSFGIQKATLQIGDYGGTESIAKLSAFPLDFHRKKEKLCEKLTARGAIFESLAGAHYKSYDGIGWRIGQWGKKEKHTIRGRIVIDTACWNRFNPNEAIQVTAFSGRSNTNVIEDHEDEDDDDEDDENPDDNGGADNNSEASYESDTPPDGFFPGEDDEEKANRRPLTNKQRLMCTPLVRGYSLATKQWLNFFVTCVHEVAFSRHAFDRLVLPADQKELILGFTETQNNLKQQAFDDVIEGKGKGMILLLSGPPGVGKTLTAESVAEEMKVPLYQMGAGDFGLDPRTVESKISDTLEMCTRWQAVLLIDEADVFLEQRSLHELERNKLVTIFLRVLEYYAGIMFLTTNRVQTFDAAFQSRIHISLEYPELSVESRHTIWTNFLGVGTAPSVEAAGSEVKLGESAATSEKKSKYTSVLSDNTITSVQLDRLASMELNGRQIKNVLKTAQLLAARRAHKLCYEDIKSVLECTMHLHASTRETDQARSAIYG